MLDAAVAAPQGLPRLGRGGLAAAAVSSIVGGGGGVLAPPAGGGGGNAAGGGGGSGGSLSVAGLGDEEVVVAREVRLCKA